MKSTVADKKGKKRTHNENVKSNQAQGDINELKKNIKKPKFDVKQNGSPLLGQKASVVHKKKEQNKIIKHQSSPIKQSTTKGETKAKTELSAAKPENETKDTRKKSRRSRPYSHVNLTAEQLTKKIAEIQSREVLSKTARKKLGILNRKLKEYGVDSEKLDALQKKSNKKAENRVNVLMKKANDEKWKANDEKKMKLEKIPVQSKGKLQKIDDDDDSEEEEIDSDVEEESEEEESDENERQNVQLTVKREEVENESDEDEDEEDDEDEDDEDDDDDDEDENELEMEGEEELEIEEDEELESDEDEEEIESLEDEGDEEDDEDDEEDEDEENEEDETQKNTNLKKLVLSGTKKKEMQNKQEQNKNKQELNKNKQEQNKNKQVQNKNAQEQSKNKQVPQSFDNQQKGELHKKRYVLFVGNLPLDITEDEIKQHFLTKVNTISSIRIPTKPDKTSRGFAYVEMTNNIDFEKGLSLNHTFLKKRRINVEYSRPSGGKNHDANKKFIVAKNMKLQALQKAGKLAGGNQKKKFKKEK